MLLQHENATINKNKLFLNIKLKIFTVGFCHKKMIEKENTI